MTEWITIIVILGKTSGQYSESGKINEKKKEVDDQDAYFLSQNMIHLC